MTETALVTGGSAGIGLAICRHFLNAGYEVVSFDRQPAPLPHARLHPVMVDLADESATVQAAADAIARYPVATVVHDAGAMRPALLADVTQADLVTLTRLHLGAAIAIVQAALPTMQARKFGRIVLITSRAALGLSTRTAYSATKAGMIGMMRTWALELGQFGITANAVAPGPIETDMFHQILPVGDPRIDTLADSIPVRRIGQPDDVARAVMFLADPANSFVTGQTLFVCGGSSVGSLAL